MGWSLNQRSSSTRRLRDSLLRCQLPYQISRLRLKSFHRIEELICRKCSETEEDPGHPLVFRSCSTLHKSLISLPLYNVRPTDTSSHRPKEIGVKKKVFFSPKVECPYCKLVIEFDDCADIAKFVAICI